MLTFKILGFVLAIYTFLTATLAASTTTEDGQRGLARMMNLNDYGSMEKRDRATWYHGIDLRNAACFGRKGLGVFHAKVEDMIGAMAMDDFEECFKCMEVTNNGNRRKIVVRIVDKCAACKVGSAIDLTPKAFFKLSPHGDLDRGVLDISYKAVKCPNNGILPKLPKIPNLLKHF